MVIKIGYWNIRALVAPIEYLLKLANVPYEIKRYDFKGELGDEGIIDEWLADKDKLGLSFPNLPYMIDGDLKITQSLAIMKYIARKYNLTGLPENACPVALAKADMIEQQLNDLRWNYIYYGISMPLIDFRYPEGFPESLPRQLGPMSTFLSTNDYILGDKVSYLDMILFEIIDIFKMLNPDCCTAFPNLEAYYSRVKNIPQIKEFLDSSESVKWPVLGIIATKWGYKK